MSVSYYRGRVASLTQDDADLQKKIGAQLAKIAKLTGEMGALQRRVTKSTSPGIVQMKSRQFESKHKDLAKAHDILADLQRKHAAKLKELDRYAQSLERTEEQDAKKRRAAEKHHAKSITSEVERQRRLHVEMSRSPMVIDLARLPMKIKVLFLAANPLEMISPASPPLQLDEELRAIQRKIRESEYRDAVELIPWLAVRTDDLLQALNEHKPHIVHFSGHGDTNGDLIFQMADGSSQRVSKAAIAATMKTLTDADNLRLIIFNSCFSEAQAVAVTEHIGCAIGMNDAIGDEAARLFAAQFYSAIGFGRSVQTAFDQAKARLMLEGIGEEDTPEMHTHSEADPASIILVRP